MCVRDVDARCVLQFTRVHAAGRALHRRASRVIRRSELFTDNAILSSSREEKKKKYKKILWVKTPARRGRALRVIKI